MSSPSIDYVKNKHTIGFDKFKKKPFLKGLYAKKYEFKAFVLDVTDPKTNQLIDRVIEILIHRPGKHSSIKDWQIIEKIQSQYGKIKTSTLLIAKNVPGGYRDIYESELLRVEQLIKGKTYQSIVQVRGKKQLVNLKLSDITEIQKIIF